MEDKHPYVKRCKQIFLLLGQDHLRQVHLKPSWDTVLFSISHCSPFCFGKKANVKPSLKKKNKWMLLY